MSRSKKMRFGYWKVGVRNVIGNEATNPHVFDDKLDYRDVH